jgi:hypothetical protein
MERHDGAAVRKAPAPARGIFLKFGRVGEEIDERNVSDDASLSERAHIVVRTEEYIGWRSRIRLLGGDELLGRRVSLYTDMLRWNAGIGGKLCDLAGQEFAQCVGEIVEDNLVICLLFGDRRDYACKVVAIELCKVDLSGHVEFIASDGLDSKTPW